MQSRDSSSQMLTPSPITMRDGRVNMNRWRCRAETVLVQRAADAQRRRNAALRAEIDEVKLSLTGGALNAHLGLESSLAAVALDEAAATARRADAERARLRARLAALERQIALLPAAVARRKERVLDRLYLEHHGAPAGAAPGPALPPLPPVTEQGSPTGAAPSQAIMSLLDVTAELAVGGGDGGGGGEEFEGIR